MRTSAPRGAQRHRLVARGGGGDRPQRRERRARGRDQAEHARAAAGRDGVEVRRAPDAAVDVLAPADLHRREDPRHGAARQHGLGDGRARRVGRAEDHAPPAGAVDGGDPQAAVEARAERVDVLAEVAERALRPRRAAAGPRRGRAARRARSSASASGANGVATALPARAAPRPTRAEAGRPRGHVGLDRRSGSGRSRPLARGAVARLRPLAGRQRRGDDRARRRPEQVLAVAEVQARRRPRGRSSTPRSHASPSVPPAPSTSASGRSRIASSRSARRKLTAAKHPCPVAGDQRAPMDAAVTLGGTRHDASELASIGATDVRDNVQT